MYLHRVGRAGRFGTKDANDLGVEGFEFLQPYTLNLILDSKPESHQPTRRNTSTPNQEARNPKPETRNPKPETLNPKPYFLGVRFSVRVLGSLYPSREPCLKPNM